MILIIFIFGLIVGSFLNAVIFRLKARKSFVGGRSVCMHCKKELRALDLIPLVSYMMLRGKCRYCEAKLSVQYPLVEAVTAFVFVFLFLAAGQNISLQLTFNFYFSAILIVIAVYDFKHFLILDKVVFPNIIIAFFGGIIIDLFTACNLVSIHCHLGGGIVGAILASGFFLGQYIVSNGRWIGFGDVKLGLLLGFILGWPNTVVSLFLAYVLGATVGVGLILLGKKQMSSQLPFGTFLAISAIITLALGDQILNWYLQLIGF
ncbi:MAG TPA: prepilin peptidase [Verrucomicrobiae bacterium]|nr:prepilin peptidase [Verrucomicrobiae bacterium]